MAWLRQRDIDDEKRTPHVIVRLRGRFSHLGVSPAKAESELKKLGVKTGWKILDFGCGSGVYTMAAARLAGRKGMVHAVDLHPANLEMIEKKAKELGLGNIDTVYSDLHTGIDDESMDAALICNELKRRKNVKELLEEVHRVIKPSGVLLVWESGMKRDMTRERVLKDGLFQYKGSEGKVLKFRKIKGAFHEI